MKRTLTILLFIVLALTLLPAAKCTPDRVFVDGVENYTDKILPEYDKYLEEDKRLTETTKEIRLGSSAGLRALIKQAKEKK